MLPESRCGLASQCNYRVVYACQNVRFGLCTPVSLPGYAQVASNFDTLENRLKPYKFKNSQIKYLLMNLRQVKKE